MYVCVFLCVYVCIQVFMNGMLLRFPLLTSIVVYHQISYRKDILLSTEYVDAIFATMVDGIVNGTLGEEQKHLRNTSLPPMNAMLQKQSVSEVIAK